MKENQGERTWEGQGGGPRGRGGVISQDQFCRGGPEHIGETSWGKKKKQERWGSSHCGLGRPEKKKGRGNN